MLLRNLINKLPKEKNKLIINGLSDNSKKVKKGFIFFAISGYKTNGEKYIHEAIERGASVVVCSKKCNFRDNNILIIKTLDVRCFMSQISAKFYKLKPKNIIAVTGTNGKTSVADTFYQILNLNNIPVASIGTLGIKYNNKISRLNLTSPDTISLHHKLENIKKKKIDNVIIEASSHGLHQKRINHLKLKAGIFTNFSQDHLDYHKSMRSYLNAKLLLFNKILEKKKILICDKSIKEFKDLQKISKKRKLRLIEISKIEKKLENLPGFNLNEFEIKNLSMAIEAAKLCNLTETKILKSLNRIKNINGRLELVKTFSNNVKVYIDFAHTPDALSKLLKVFKKTECKNISLVFGCGGNRDIKKRSLMGKIASSNCKKIYVTDDNPRDESPEKIRRMIIKNIKNSHCYNIGNREKAIKTAILEADPNDTIIIAGKGHENKQIYKNKTILISDKQIVKKIKIKRISLKKRTFLQNKQILSKIKKIKNIQNFHGLAIDSREIKKDNIFLTIKGNKNNGINFISEALKKGAKYIVSSKIKKKYKQKIIKVKSEIKFLNEFANLKRKLSNASIIAITGSAGKTSLKNLINDLLQNFGNTFCSPKSYNNHFGVPLSLSQLSLRNKYGIFEVGMSKAGEISTLSRLIRPQIAIITNIGEAHLENFKDLKGIAEAKGEIIKNVVQGGTIILNRDDNYFNYLSKEAKIKNLKIVSFGKSKKSDIQLIMSLKDNFKIKANNQVLSLKIENLNIYNVLASIALLKVLNLDLTKTIKFFINCEPSDGRGKIHNIKRHNKDFKLIDESYNANPLSVRNAINNFNSIKKKNFKKFLLLGDMLELGKKSEMLHKKLSKVINSSDIDKVFVKGKKALTTYKNINTLKRGNILQEDEDVDFIINNFISNNDYLMIKGSNKTGLNNITKRIIKGH